MTISGNNSAGPLILKNGVGGYTEGLRVCAASNKWSDLILLGDDAAETSGTSAKSWFLGNYDGDFYITKNGSTSGTTGLSCVSNVWKIDGNSLITSGNISSQSVNYANSAGNADTVDNEHSSAFAHRQYWNNMTHSSNEYTWIAPSYSGDIWINYRTSSGSLDGNITKYIFGNGKGGALASISSNTFNGNCSGSAGSVSWSNVTSGSNSNSYTCSNFTLSSTNPLTFLGSGSGTYNQAALYVSQSDGITFETPRASDSGSSATRGFHVKTRGGQYDNFYCANAYASSDRHLKKDIHSIDKRSLDDLFNVSDKLIKSFKWKQTDKASYGLIAQELEQWIPEAVEYVSKDTKTVNYQAAFSKIIAALVHKVKEQANTIEEIKSMLSAIS